MQLAAHFNLALFWDCDPNTLEFDKHFFYILERVIERGAGKDFLSAKQFFSKDQIREVLIKSRDISPKSCNFAAFFFNILDFKLYPPNQTEGTYWIY